MTVLLLVLWAFFFFYFARLKSMYGKNSVWSFCTESSTVPHLRAFRMRENSCFIAGYTTRSHHLFTSCVSCTLRRVHVKVRAALCDTAPISRGKQLLVGRPLHQELISNCLNADEVVCVGLPDHISFFLLHPLSVSRRQALHA